MTSNCTSRFFMAAKVAREFLIFTTLPAPAILIDPRMHIPQTEVILRNDGIELARVTLPPGDYVIGRNADAEIFADTPLLSRRHAQLTINYDHLLIEDLGSSNGTFVGEQRIAEATRLFPNQSVRLGDITVEIHRQRAPTEPRVSLAPAQTAIRRFLPEEILAEKRYAIGSELARGGMGAILDARQNATQRTVAMKVMLGSGDEGDVLRFIEEAQVTAQLDHPNIVPIYELGVDEQDQLFYTMKLVRGITLKKVLELLEQGVEATVKKYPLPALLTVFQKVCDAVAFAHSKGVIHRDLKPENIMLGDFGSVLVMDWGLAKVLGTQASSVSGAQAGSLQRSFVMSARANVPDSGSTMSGTIMGTPQYMAPEQARGEVETLDARADIYALGAILFHVLHLRPGVTGEDAMEIVGKVERGEIAWDAKRHPRIPESLLAVCRKALALDRAQRYPRVEDLQADLLAYQNGFATSAEKAGAWKQFALLVKRNKAASIGVAAVLVLSIGFTAKVITEGRRAENALADLRSAAPTLISQARGLIDQQKFDDALTKIDFAVKIDGKNADYHLLRAQVLEATLRLAEAAAEFRRVLALGPNDSAKANLALCEKLLRDNKGSADIDDPSLKALHELLLKEQRTTQDVPIAARLGLGRAATDARVKALFDVWRKLPGWEKREEKDRFHYEADGTVFLLLDSLPVSDLSVLKGIPISILSISSTKVEDLSPLAGFRLVNFGAVRAPISDLSPLRGMPLKILNIPDCRKVEDLSSLAGMPLEFCNLGQVQATDFSPLKKCPIKTLDVSQTRITTLDAFAGMPCEKLTASDAKSLVDISAVRTMRLKYADFGNSTGIGDLAPLADCPDIEELAVPRTAKNAASLRRLTKLRWIVYGGDPRCSAEELWVKLGIADDRDREHIALTQKARAALTACGATNPDVNWVKVLPDGTLDLWLSRPEFKTLAPLRGLPVSALDIHVSSITDLSPLADMPLRKLAMAKTRVADLSPLAKFRKLEILVCCQNAVRDLSPLAGLPLVYLDVSGDSVSSIAPLAGMPLKELQLQHTSVSDLRALLSCPTLEWLTLPTGARDVDQLRALKKLSRLSERWDASVEGSAYDRGGPAQTAEEFWKEYDAKNGAPTP
jgi:serine/threonine protein kinase/Leucine-rich repeat (LRR) protein